MADNAPARAPGRSVSWQDGGKGAGDGGEAGARPARKAAAKARAASAQALSVSKLAARRGSRRLLRTDTGADEAQADGEARPELVQFDVEFVLPGGWRAAEVPAGGAVGTRWPRSADVRAALKLEQDFHEETRRLREEALAKKKERDELVAQLRAADEANKKRLAEEARTAEKTSSKKKKKKDKEKDNHKETHGSPKPSAKAERPAWMDVPDVKVDVSVAPDVVQRATIDAAQRYTHELLTLRLTRNPNTNVPFLPQVHEACLRTVFGEGTPPSISGGVPERYREVSVHTLHTKFKDGSQRFEKRSLKQGMGIGLRVVVPDFGCPVWNKDQTNLDAVLKEHHEEEAAKARAAAGLDDENADADGEPAAEEAKPLAPEAPGADSTSSGEPTAEEGGQRAEEKPKGFLFGHRAGELDTLSENPELLDDPHAKALARKAKLYAMGDRNFDETQASSVDKNAWLEFTVEDLAEHRLQVEMIETEDDLMKWAGERPFSPEALRAKARSQLRARASDPETAFSGGLLEAAHGLWELAVHYAAEFTSEDCEALLACLRGPPSAKWAAAACVWKLAAKARQRGLLAETGCIEQLISNVRVALGWNSPRVVEKKDKFAKLFYWRDRLLYHHLGALNVLAVDARARIRANSYEENFRTLMATAGMEVSRTTINVEQYLDYGTSIYAQIRAVRHIQREYRDMLQRRGVDVHKPKVSFEEDDGEKRIDAESRLRKGMLTRNASNRMVLSADMADQVKQTDAAAEEESKREAEEAEETGPEETEEKIEAEDAVDDFVQEIAVDLDHIDTFTGERAEFESAFDDEVTEDNIRLAEKIDRLNIEEQEVEPAETVLSPKSIAQASSADARAGRVDAKFLKRQTNKLVKVLPPNPLDAAKYWTTVPLVIGRKRQMSAEVLYSMLQRDKAARHAFCRADGIRLLMPLLHSENKRVSFISCMLLANFALDSELAKIIAETGSSLRLFDELVYQISVCMDKLEMFSSDGLHQFTEESGDGDEFVHADADVDNVTRMLESSACAVWGISHSLVEVAEYNVAAVDPKRIARLTFLASRSLATPGVGLSTQSLAGCIGVFSHHRPTSLLMSEQIDPHNPMHQFGDVDDALRVLLRPPMNRTGVTKRGTGWVRATATSAVGCLAYHEYKRGEEPPELLEEEDVESSRCLYGPNRAKLVECRLVESILEAQEARTWIEEARGSLDQAAAGCIMLLSTAEAGWLDTEIRDALALASSATSLDVCQYLGAALWIQSRKDTSRVRLLEMHSASLEQAMSAGGEVGESVPDSAVKSGDGGGGDDDASSTCSFGIRNEKAEIFDPLGSLASLIDNVLQGIQNLVDGRGAAKNPQADYALSVSELAPFGYYSMRLKEVSYFRKLTQKVRRARRLLQKVTVLKGRDDDLLDGLLGDDDGKRKIAAHEVDHLSGILEHVDVSAILAAASNSKDDEPDHGTGEQAWARWKMMIREYASRKGKETISLSKCGANALVFSLGAIWLLIIGPDGDLDFLYRDDDLFAMDAKHLSWWTSKPVQGGLATIREGSGLRRALRMIAEIIGRLPLGRLDEIGQGWGARFANGISGEWAVESVEFFHAMRLACGSAWALSAADAELKRCLLEDGVLENAMRVVESWSPTGFGGSPGDDTARVDLPDWKEAPDPMVEPGWGGSDPAPGAMRVAIGLLMHLCRQPADPSDPEGPEKLWHQLGVVRLSTALAAAAAYGSVRDVRMADSACAALVWLAHAAGPEGRAQMVESNFVARMLTVIRACYVRAEPDEDRWLELGWGYAGAHTEAVMRIGDLALTALVNLSVDCSEAQVDICKRGVMTLLRVARQDPDIELAGHSPELATMILVNCSLNSANTTRLYKLELTRNRLALGRDADSAASMLEQKVEMSKLKREAWKQSASKHKKGGSIREMQDKTVPQKMRRLTTTELKKREEQEKVSEAKERFLSFAEDLGAPKMPIIGRVLKSENSLLPKPKEAWESYADPGSIEMVQLRRQRERARSNAVHAHWPVGLPPPTSDIAKRAAREMTLEEQHELVAKQYRPSSRESRFHGPDRPSTPFDRLAESFSEPALNMTAMGTATASLVGRATGECFRTVSQRIRASKQIELAQPVDDATYRPRQGKARWLPRLSRYHHRVDEEAGEEAARLREVAREECGTLIKTTRPTEVAAYFEETFENAVARASSRLALAAPESSMALAAAASPAPAAAEDGAEKGNGDEDAAVSPGPFDATPNPASPGSPRLEPSTNADAETPAPSAEETHAADGMQATVDRPLSPEARRARTPSALGARPPVFPAHFTAMVDFGTKVIEPREDVSSDDFAGGFGFSGVPTLALSPLSERPHTSAGVVALVEEDSDAFLATNSSLADEARPLTVMHRNRKHRGRPPLPSPADSASSMAPGAGGDGAVRIDSVGPTGGLQVDADERTRPVEATIGNNTPRGPGYHAPTNFNWTHKRKDKRRKAAKSIAPDEPYFDEDIPNDPSLSVFRHVPGAVVYEGLIPTFPLPNGREAHYYWTAKKGCDSILVPLEGPPARPTNLRGLGKLSLPSLPLFSELNIPKARTGSTTYNPVPPLGPDPTRHSLRDTGRFGDLVDDNLRFEVLPRYLYKIDLEVKDTPPPPPDERPVFNIDASVYAPRRFKEADCKTYWDTEACHRRMFQFDWTLICDRGRFRKFCVVQVKGANKNVNIGETEFKQLKELIRVRYHDIISMHSYYSTQGTGRGFRMTQNAWEKFCDDTALITDRFNARDAIEQFIIATIVDGDTKLKEMGGNLQRAGSMGRREFIECLIRSAVWLFGHDKNPSIAEADERANSPEGALQMLFEKHIDPNMNPMVGYIRTRNDFRTERLYNLEMEIMWRSNCATMDRGDGKLVAIRKGLCLELLKHLYSELGVRRTKHGKEIRMPQKETFLELLVQTLEICTTQMGFSLIEAFLCYKASQMDVVDDVAHQARSESLNWVDFLEAIGRVADALSLPPAENLVDAGFYIGTWPDLNPGWTEIRESADMLLPKTRPLVEKVTALLTLIFWRKSDDYDESLNYRVKSWKARGEASNWRQLPGM